MKQSLLFACLLLPAFLPAAAPARPNVLFIAVDDLKPLIGCYGYTHARTPNMDLIAAKGTVFTRAYCMQAVCSPSRNGVLTGLRPEVLQIYDLATNFRKRAPEVVTLPQHFKQLGWQSHGVGKIFHVGHGNTEDAASWSVPHFQAKSIGYALEENKATLTREEALFANQNPKEAYKLPRGAAYESAEVPDDAYGDGKIALEAVSRLRGFKESGSPFFLAVGFVKPHLPFCAPKKYWDLYNPETLPQPDTTSAPTDAPGFAATAWGELRQYKGIPETGPIPPDLTRALIHGYLAATSYMDAQLGLVLDELDKLGLAENTIIVLWGDHGWHLGDHGMWCKHTNYEQATNAPLLIAAPGKKGGQKAASPVEFNDIYPTLCDLAGIEKPFHLQGASLVPMLEDPAASVKPAAFQVYPRNSPETGPLLGHAMRTPRWRYVEWRKADHSIAAQELYDMENDARETVNLAGKPEHAATVAGLSAQLSARLSEPPPAGLKLLDRPASAAAGAKGKEGKPKKPKQDRNAMFNRRDKDGDGKLSREEFLKDQPDPDEAPKRWTKFDKDKDGFLTREEFVNPS